MSVFSMSFVQLVIRHVGFLHVQKTGTLHDSLACSGFPAPSAIPTLTLAAADSPIGNYREINWLLLIKATFPALNGIFFLQNYHVGYDC